jgi:hypothetical protein
MCQAVAENLPIIRKRIACWPACEKLLDGRHFRITEMFKPGSKDILFQWSGWSKSGIYDQIRV